MSKRFWSQRCAVVALAALMFALPPRLALGQTAQTTCKDGTTSATSGRGACSGHGGVDKNATAAARSSTRESASARVTCSDGTTSKAGRGACSRHGGVASGAIPSPTTTELPQRSAAPSRASRAAPALPSPLPAEAPARTRSDARSRAPSAVGSGGGEDSNPVGSIAQCKDGLYSHAKHRRGACSRHGGVAKWTAA
jgi:hypothetical protein